jgi:hypothetical protein
MIRISIAILSFLITVVIFAGSVQAQEVVPIHKEPFHQLVERQQNLRILDVQIPPGQTTLYHIHDRPIHYVLLEDATTQGQILGQEWPSPEEHTDSKATQNIAGMSVVDLDYIHSPKTHRVRNVDDHLFRLIAVINDGGGLSQGYTEFQPAGWTTENFTNRWFASSRMDVSVDIPSNWTTAESDTVLVNPKGATLMLSYKDAPNAASALGHWQLINKGMTYQVSNTGTAPASLVVVKVR